LKIYIDGFFDNSMTISYTNVDNLAPIIIGANNIDHNSQNYKGVMDDIRVYNRALSLAEIQTLFLESPQTPYVDVTNANRTVIYDNASTSIAGSNNINVVALGWSNSLTGARGTLSPGSPWWTINGIVLNVGANVITVYGTNAMNVATSDSVTITRGGTSTATPYVDVTNANQTVTYDILASSIGGSNNVGVATLAWSNSLTGAGGTLSPGSPWWTINGIALNVGANMIAVYGTNALNVATSDSVTITRGPAGTGVPFTDVTNVDTWVTYDRTEWAVAGTNNVNVVGRMNVLNTSFGGSAQDFAAALNWTAPTVNLSVGANTLLVTGTNAFGALVSDTVTITRGPAGTGVPFAKITNGYMWVTYDVTSYTVAGTNNLNVVGDMRVLNATVGGAATPFAAGLHWLTPAFSLAVGTNNVMVFGTNAFGTITMDSMIVERGPAGTGAPFVDVTNANAWVTYDVTTTGLAGTNNLNVVGMINWTNALTGAQGTVPAALTWNISGIVLAVGVNAIVY